MQVQPCLFLRWPRFGMVADRFGVPWMVVVAP